ncbi:hypothetical protein ABZ776_38220, partial [Streptomyces sp. NPDC007076]|uniref:hypothetical protein n=1 Tax=Streptomyces sp. NPDC007076 TaxID=3160975 RepID=UPI0033C5A07B
MTRLHHTVTVRAPERERLDAYAGLVWDLVESTRAQGRSVVLPDGRAVPGLTLVRGHHLRPGARYESHGPDSGEPDTTVIREWRRGSVIAVEQLMRSPESSGRMALRLRSPDRPASLEVAGRLRGPEGSGSPHRLSGRASLDLAAFGGGPLGAGECGGVLLPEHPAKTPSATRKTCRLPSRSAARPPRSSSPP